MECDDFNKICFRKATRSNFENVNIRVFQLVNVSIIIISIRLIQTIQSSTSESHLQQR